MSAPSDPPAAEAPWLSVLMPVHEGARWLAGALASVVEQDCRGVEVLILDSGAEPTCASMAAAVAPRVSVTYRHCPDIASWTLKTNLAAELARAPHLAVLHQDDRWLPGRVDAVRAGIAACPEAGLFLSPTRIVDAEGRPLGTWRCPLRPGPIPPALLLERLMVQNFVSVPAPVFRRDAWLAAGGLDTGLWYTPDWDLYLKIARATSVVYAGEATTAFRVHAGSLTMTGSRAADDFTDQMTAVLARHIDAVAPHRRAGVLKAARASVRVNRSLAIAAATGAKGELVRAGLAVLGLTPPQARRFWRDTRIVERVLPRLRARLAGAF